MDGEKMQRRFAIFAWLVLAYNLPVILWGAYVRASFSGDGCGAHWPSCNGSVIPQHMAAPMAIEFTHRAMTSVDTLAVIALCIGAFLAFPRKHQVRMYSVLSLAFLFIEALLGAGLVLFRYVARDQSAGRVWYLSAHLTNTMLLLAALTLTACLASSLKSRTTGNERPARSLKSRTTGNERPVRSLKSRTTGNERPVRSRISVRFRFRSVPPRLFGAAAVVVFVSITGVIAALGDTLLPAASLSAGMQQDFSSAASVLVRLRVLHPMIAIAGAAYLFWAAAPFLKSTLVLGERGAARSVVALTLFQLVAGAVNLSLLAPIWMQLFHLLIADALWISLVVLVFKVAASRSSEAATEILREDSVALPRN